MKALGKALAILFALNLFLPAVPISVAALPAKVGDKALPSLAPMLEQTTPGVVNIATRGRVKVRNNPLFEDPFFGHFFNLPKQPSERVTQSLGSGVIVDAKNGYVLTNHHVVANAEEIILTLKDDRRLDAKVIGTDPDSDVAVLKVEADNLTAVPWGDSDALRQGDFVVAIGNPFGLGQTVTDGIVSALSRSGLGIEEYEDFIQTSAPINPGNSGGALVDLNGRLIGINTAILGSSGGNIGIGFAIPARMARQIMEQLLEYGEVRRGRLGVVVQNLGPELANAFGLKHQRGAVISRIENGSAAEQAGLKAGDIVIEVNGRKVKSSADMRNVIGLQRIGQVVEMKVIRDGKARIVTAEIAEPKLTSVDGKVLHPQLAGAQLAATQRTLKKRISGKGVPGVQVVEIESHSPASLSGLRRGDIITSVNRQVVNDIETAKRAAETVQRGMLLNILRGDTALFIVLQ